MSLRHPHSMKIGLTILLIIFAVSIFGHLQAANAQKEIQHTLLFEVKSPDRKAVSYIFGTHHAFSKSFFDKLEMAKARLTEASIVITESNPQPGHTAIEIVNSRSIETSWSKYLTKDDLSYVRKRLKNNPINFDKLLPEELHAALIREHTIDVCRTRTTEDPDLTIDDYISLLAKQLGKQVIGLETVEEQLELIRKDLEGMPPKVHKKRLTNLIALIKNGQNGANCEACQMYADMAFNYQLDKPCGNTLLLTDRNTQWIDNIEDQLKMTNCFIAVGLSHLQFDCGLISQLRSRGFTVTPVPAK